MKEMLARCFALSVSVGFATWAGCGSDAVTGDGDDSTNVTITNGSGYSPDCADGQPDGLCVPHASVPDTCACVVDCGNTPYCTGGCTDDGTCDFDPENGGEDCTCLDCAYMHPACGESSGNGNMQTTGNATTDTTASTTGNTTNTTATTGGMGGAPMGGMGGAPMGGMGGGGGA